MRTIRHHKLRLEGVKKLLKSSKRPAVVSPTAEATCALVFLMRAAVKQLDPFWAESKVRELAASHSDTVLSHLHIALYKGVLHIVLVSPEGLPRLGWIFKRSCTIGVTVR